MHRVSFHPVAPYYDKLAKLVFGKAIQKAQIVYLHQIPQNSHLLIVGGGSGWIIEELVRRGQCSQITFLETAPAMIEMAKKRYEKLGTETDVKVNFVLGSVNALPADTTFDAVITFFLLDLYPTREAFQLADEINNRLQSGGIWLFADFDPKSKIPVPLWQQILLGLMYFFFGLTTNLRNRTLPDYEGIFNHLHLDLYQHCYSYHSFIRSALYRKQ